MVIPGKPRVDSVEDFLQQNALHGNIVADLVDAGDTTDTASIASTAPTQSSVGLVITLRGPRKAKQQRYPKPIDGPSSKKGMGVRKWRRYQNTVGLLTGIQEEESLEDSFAADIAEESGSAFTELFENPAKMHIWEKFMKLSENDQRRFLLAIAEDLERVSSGGYYDDDDDQPKTAEECFRRIDRNLRRLVARRSPPVDLIAPMEEELLQFFGERPQDVFDVVKADTYQRMVLHAICQYFGLLSKSVKNHETCRTQVRNRSRKGTFCQPPQRLSVFLTERYDL